MAQCELNKRQSHHQQDEGEAGLDEHLQDRVVFGRQHRDRRHESPDDKSRPAQQRGLRAGKAGAPQKNDDDEACDGDDGECETGKPGRIGRLEKAIDRQCQGQAGKGEHEIARDGHALSQFDEGDEAQGEARQHEAFDDRADLLAGEPEPADPSPYRGEVARLDRDEADRCPDEERRSRKNRADANGVERNRHKANENCKAENSAAEERLGVGIGIEG